MEPGYIPDSADVPTVADRLRDEQLVKGAQLAETDLKRFFPEQANYLLISKGAKRTIKALSFSLFDNGKRLARLDHHTAITYEISVYQARIEINTAMCGVKPSDRRNQEFVNLLGLMIHHYRHYLSGAIGGWALLQQNEVTVNQKSDITQKIQQSPLPQSDGERGGLGGMFNGIMGK